MGDLGDYWREHREYSRKQKLRRLGCDSHAAPTKPFLCGVDDCTKRFGSAEGLAQHLRDKHKVKTP